MLTNQIQKGMTYNLLIYLIEHDKFDLVRNVRVVLYSADAQMEGKSAHETTIGEAVEGLRGVSRTERHGLPKFDSTLYYLSLFTDFTTFS